MRPQRRDVRRLRERQTRRVLVGGGKVRAGGGFIADGILRFRGQIPGNAAIGMGPQYSVQRAKGCLRLAVRDQVLNLPGSRTGLGLGNAGEHCDRQRSERQKQGFSHHATPYGAARGVWRCVRAPDDVTIYMEPRPREVKAAKK